MCRGHRRLMASVTGGKSSPTAAATNIGDGSKAPGPFKVRPANVRLNGRLLQFRRAAMEAAKPGSRSRSTDVFRGWFRAGAYRAARQAAGPAVFPAPAFHIGHPSLTVFGGHGVGPHHRHPEPVPGEDVVHPPGDVPGARVGGVDQHPPSLHSLGGHQVDERSLLQVELLHRQGRHLHDDLAVPGVDGRLPLGAAVGVGQKEERRDRHARNPDGRGQDPRAIGPSSRRPPVSVPACGNGSGQARLEEPLYGCFSWVVQGRRAPRRPSSRRPSRFPRPRVPLLERALSNLAQPAAGEPPPMPDPRRCP